MTSPRRAPAARTSTPTHWSTPRAFMRPKASARRSPTAAVHPHPRGFGGMQRASAACGRRRRRALGRPARPDLGRANLSMSGIPNWTHDIGGFALEERYRSEARPTWPSGASCTCAGSSSARSARCSAATASPRSARADHRRTPWQARRADALPPAALPPAAVHLHPRRRDPVPRRHDDAAGDGLRAIASAGDRRPVHARPGAADGPGDHVRSARAIGLPARRDRVVRSRDGPPRRREHVSDSAPRERMPLLVRAGAIALLGREVQWTGEDPQGPLTPHLSAGADGASVVYYDQGEGWPCARGVRGSCRCGTTGAGADGACERALPGMAATRRIGVVVHDARRAWPVSAAEPVRVGWICTDGHRAGVLTAPLNPTLSP